MNIKSMLFPILFCFLFVFLAVSVTSTQIVRAEQSTEEIEKIRIKNEEYEKTHPKPSDSPPPLQTAWCETSMNEKSLHFVNYRADGNAVVYIDKDTGAYHMGDCRYYAEKSGGDYTRPRWLSEIVLDGTRCTLCVSDSLYSTQKEAVLRTKINDLECDVNILRGLIILLTVCIAAWECKKVKKTKGLGKNDAESTN